MRLCDAAEQRRQAYFGRRVTSTRSCAGIRSSRSETSSPILVISPQPQGQRILSGSMTRSTRGRWAGSGPRLRLRAEAPPADLPLMAASAAPEQPVPMRPGDLLRPIAAHLARGNSTRPAIVANPGNHRADAHAETSSSLPARKAVTFNGQHNPFAKIDGKWSRHLMLPLRTAEMVNLICSQSGIPNRLRLNSSRSRSGKSGKRSRIGRFRPLWLGPAKSEVSQLVPSSIQPACRSPELAS